MQNSFHLNVRLFVIASCNTDRNFSAGLLYALKKLGTSCLNSSKSAKDFSRDTILSLHLIQIYIKERGPTDFSVKKDFTPRVTHGMILHQRNLEYIMGLF